MKFYINAGTDTYKFASLFQEKCENLGLNYYFKVAHAYKEAEYKRNDKMCIFTERKDAEKFLEVIQQVKEEGKQLDRQIAEAREKLAQKEGEEYHE